MPTPRSRGSARAHHRCATRTPSSPACATSCATAPDVLDALLRAGCDGDPVHGAPPSDAHRSVTPPGDADLVAIACRRTTFEWVLRAGWCSTSRASSSATARPPARSTRARERSPRRRCRRRPGRPGGRRPRSALVVRRLARRDRCRTRPRGAARERHRLLLAVLPRSDRHRGAALLGSDRRRSRLSQVRDLPRRQPDLLDHLRDREPRRGAPPRPRRLRGLRDGRPFARGDRALARRRCGRSDHRRARHGRAAQPVPSPRRRRRPADRARLRRSRRRGGVHEPALRSRLQPRVRARVRLGRRVARARRRSRRAGAYLRRIHRSRAGAVVPLGGAAGHAALQELPSEDPR